MSGYHSTVAVIFLLFNVSLVETNIKRSLQLSMFKNILLKNLGLSNPPEASSSSIQNVLIERGSVEIPEEDSFDNFVEKTTVTSQGLLSGTNIIRFVFKNADFFNEQTLFNANLTVYLEKSLSSASFEIFRKTSDKHDLSIYKKIADFNENSTGWKSKDITEDLRDWLRFANKNNTKVIYKLKFHCGSKFACFTANKIPFIDIYLKSRPKRGIINQCPPSEKGCCLRGIKVSVAQLGWESWFHLPRIFTYTYCAGSCKNQSQSLYGAISSGISGKAILNGCCVATKLKGLRVLHSLDNELYDKTINNIMADECSCVGL